MPASPASSSSPSPPPRTATCACAGRSPTSRARPSRSPSLLVWLAAAQVVARLLRLHALRLPARPPAHALRLEHPAARPLQAARGAGLGIGAGAGARGGRGGALCTLRRDRVLLVTFGAWLAGRDGRRPRRRQLLRALPDRAGAGRCVAAVARDRPRAAMPIRVAALGAVAYLALTAAQRGRGLRRSPHAASARGGRRPLHPRPRPAGRHPVRHVRAAPTSSTTPASGTPTRTCGASWSESGPARARSCQRLLGSSRRPTWLV